MPRRDDGGAVAPFVAVATTVLLLVAALAIDIGMQRVGRADMQALADVVALDLARELDGRTVAELDAAGVRTSLAEQSRDRNQDVIGYDDNVPELDVRLGEMVDGDFADRTGDSGFRPTAVEVEAGTSVSFSFSGITGIGSGDATRSAAAQANGGACFSIGSYAARLDTGASPVLGPLLGALGSHVVLSAVDYNGLANAHVDLLGLLGAEVGAGTVDEVLDSSVSLGAFYLAVARALDGQHAAQAQLLQTIAAGVGTVQLALADILGVSTGAGQGLDASLNVLDLVTAAAAAATGDHALVARPSVRLGPLADVAVGLTAIEAPKTACGRRNDPRATARSAQVRVELSSALAPTSLSGVIDALVAVRAGISGTVEVASATGRLTDVRCDPAGATVGVSDGLLEVDLTLQVQVRALLGLIPVATAPVTIRGRTTTSGQAVIDIHTDADYDRPVTVGNGSSGLPRLDVDVSRLRLLSLPIGLGVDTLVGGVLSAVVNPLLQGLDTALLSPLLNSLGLDLSGADVYLHRVPACAVPRLVD